MDRTALTSERLDEAWLLLFDLAKEDSRHMTLEDRVILRQARYIVNRFQLRVGKKEITKETGKEEAADVTAPAAQEENP